MSHNPPARNYIFVLLALLVLTAVTVGLSFVNLGRPGNIAIGLLVAIIKGSLVVMFFMHLKYEHRWWAALVLFPLFLVAIIIFTNMVDTGYGDFTTPPVLQTQGRGPAH